MLVCELGIIYLSPQALYADGNVDAHRVIGDWYAYQEVRTDAWMQADASSVARGKGIAWRGR